MKGFKIKIFTTEKDHADVSVGKSHLTIGRAAYCDVQPAGLLADEHLRVWTDGHHLWAQDLGSSQGTQLEGVRLQAMRPVLFRETDTFKLGDNGPSLGFEFLTIEAADPDDVVTIGHEEPHSHAASESELRELKKENQKLRTTIQSLRQQAQRTLDPDEEEEVSEVKVNALNEVKSMKEAEARRFETWKRESIDEMQKTVLSLIKMRPDTRLSKEEVAADISAALRTVLLGERMRPVRRRRHRSEGGLKFVFILLVAGLLCIAYVARGRWAVRRPASVLYVPPHPADFVKNPTPPAATVRGSAHSRNFLHASPRSAPVVSTRDRKTDGAQDSGQE